MLTGLDWIIVLANAVLWGILAQIWGGSFSDWRWVLATAGSALVFCTLYGGRRSA